MRITCWGSRGSIPVSGPDFNRYGGDTTCLEIRSADDDILIVDAGTGIRALGNTLFSQDRRRFNFLFTHAHWDHLMGFPFFKPLYRDNVELQMFKCPFPDRYVTQMISSVMAPPHFPLRFSDLKAQITYLDACPGRFAAGSLAITPIALNHPNGGFGYKFSENGRSFVFLTDNELKVKHPKGLPYSAYLDFVRDADLLLHDAVHAGGASAEDGVGPFGLHRCAGAGAAGRRAAPGAVSSQSGAHRCANRCNRRRLPAADRRRRENAGVFRRPRRDEI
jgi:hypothetical protein